MIDLLGAASLFLWLLSVIGSFGYVQAAVAANLDCVVLEARSALESLPDYLLADLEKLIGRRHSVAAVSDGTRAAVVNKRPSAHAGAYSSLSQMEAIQTPNFIIGLVSACLVAILVVLFSGPRTLLGIKWSV